MANGAIGQQTQTLEAYATNVLLQHYNILAHSNLRPFTGSLEGYEFGASEDDVMGGELIYPNPPPQSYTQYPTANALQP